MRSLGYTAATVQKNVAEGATLNAISVGIVTATEASTELFRRGHEAGVLRADVTVGDLYYADIANGLALRHLGKPDRADYDRRTAQFTDGLRAPATGP